MKKRDYSGNFQCICGREYTNSQAFKGHQSQCKVYLESKGVDVTQYQQQRRAKELHTKSQSKEYIEEQKTLKKKLKLQAWVNENHTCEKCGKVMTEKYGSGRFCSRECANSHVKHGKYTNENIKNRKAKSNKQSHSQLLKEYILNQPKCQVCGEILTYEKRNRKTCSKDCCSKYLSKQKKDLVEKLGGNLNPYGTRGHAKYGTYKGFHCDSSYELAFVIYCLDHNVIFKRNYKGFSYKFQNKDYKYYPDFIINNTYIEIKNYKSDRVTAKIDQFPSEELLVVLYLSDIKICIDYCIEVYGKNFTELYDKDKPSWINKKDN